METPAVLNSHLLVVEDDDAVRDVIVRQIERKVNYRVSSTANAMEALELLKSDPPDVALIDIRLPDMSGIELLQRMKRVRPEVRSIMMSGLADMQDTIKALRCGAVDFFQKPLKIEDVIVSIENAMEALKNGRAGKSVQSFLAEELKTYAIPNDVALIPQLTAELSRALENEPGFCPDEVEGIRTSIHEMLLNAIEHGNLAITYEDKTKLMQSVHGLRREMEARALDPRYRDRRVTIFYENTPKAFLIRIADEGEGFDHSALPDPTQMGEIPHGRGILISRVFMDEVRYNETGNEVTLVKLKKNGSTH